VGDPAACVSPPYDQFHPAMVAKLEAQSTYNIARIVIAPDGGGPDPTGAHYVDKARLLKEWSDSGALVADQEPGIYPYSQSYSLSGKSVTRRGFIALGDLRDATILPHEETHAHVREDRAQLRAATAADFGLIFIIYSDPSGTVDRMLRDCEEGGEILRAEQPDGSSHVLRRCTDPERIERLIRHMDDLDCIIADGHHRTAAAFDAWQAKGDERWASVMMAFFNADAPGMTVLPIHRGISCPSSWEFEETLDRLSEFFQIIHYPKPGSSPEDVVAHLQGHIAEHTRVGRVAFGMVGPDADSAYLVETPNSPTVEWPWPDAMHEQTRKLPTAIFETGVLRGALNFEGFQIDRGDRISFPRDPVSMISRVRSGELQLGFVLPSTPLDAIFAVARLRQNMPQKSTFFFPKLLTGLTVHRIETGRPG
jgi:uncharacterized protein (DUF1015 family)